MLSKNNVALFLFAATLAGLLWARSVNSVGMFLFGLNALRGISPKTYFKQRWWLLGLLWVGLYILSWFWSGDKGEWAAHVQVKMPFLILPLAFSLLDPWRPSQLRVFTILFVVILLSGAAYSASFMMLDPAKYIAGYKYSHTLPVPKYIDHISFSTLIAICVVWCVYSWPFWCSKMAKTILAICMALLTVYLHVLAAKTGLIALYIMLLTYLVFLFWDNWKKGAISLALFLTLIVTVVVFRNQIPFPTLRERINYSLYSYKLYKEGERNGLYSDMGRMISYNLALKIIWEKPLIGVGAGDVLHEMTNKYKIYYPNIPKEQHLYPHNQFLTTALAAGIPAALALICWMLAPFGWLRKNRESFFFVIIWLGLLVPLMVDPFLEVQAGVFVYLFFLGMHYSLLRKGVVNDSKIKG